MKILLTIKPHKIDFVMGLLRNMPFVNIEILEGEKEEIKE